MGLLLSILGWTLCAAGLVVLLFGFFIEQRAFMKRRLQSAAWGLIPLVVGVATLVIRWSM